MPKQQTGSGRISYTVRELLERQGRDFIDFAGRMERFIDSNEKRVSALEAQALVLQATMTNVSSAMATQQKTNFDVALRLGDVAGRVTVGIALVIAAIKLA